MLSTITYWDNRLAKARAFLEVRPPQAAVDAAAMVDSLVHLTELETFLRDLEREARRFADPSWVEGRDSNVYGVLELLDGYEALIREAEEIVGSRLDALRGVLERQPYWAEESDPLKFSVPGSSASPIF